MRIHGFLQSKTGKIPCCGLLFCSNISKVNIIMLRGAKSASAVFDPENTGMGTVDTIATVDGFFVSDSKSSDLVSMEWTGTSSFRGQ